MHAAEGEIIMYTYILFFGWASFLSLAGVGGAKKRFFRFFVFSFPVRSTVVVVAFFILRS